MPKVTAGHTRGQRPGESGHLFVALNSHSPWLPGLPTVARAGPEAGGLEPSPPLRGLGAGHSLIVESDLSCVQRRHHVPHHLREATFFLLGKLHGRMEKAHFGIRKFWTEILAPNQLIISPFFFSPRQIIECSESHFPPP